jgi:hypothetical protein
LVQGLPPTAAGSSGVGFTGKLRVAQAQAAWW